MKMSFFVSVSALFLFTACSVPFDDLGITGSGLPKVPALDKLDVDNMVVNFETVTKVSLKNCTKCHAGGNLNLTKPEVVVTARAKILDQISSGTMPPSPQV